jgi:hypothetical protein
MGSGWLFDFEDDFRVGLAVAGWDCGNGVDEDLVGRDDEDMAKCRGRGIFYARL